MLLKLKDTFYVELLHVEDIFMYKEMLKKGHAYYKTTDRARFDAGDIKLIVTNTRGGYSYSWLTPEEYADLSTRLEGASI